MKKIKFFALALAATMTLGLVGCNKDHDEGIEYQTVEITSSTPLEINTTADDAYAFYALHFTISISNGEFVATGLSNKATQEAQEHHMTALTDWNTKATIADCGKGKGVSSITKMPGTFVEIVQCNDKYGYVVKAEGVDKTDYPYSEVFPFKNPETKYMRFWVEEVTSNGYKIRYQYPWVPEK